MLPRGETQAQAAEGGLIFNFQFIESGFTREHRAGDEDRLPRGADISNRDGCCRQQTAGPRAGAWKNGRKRFAVSSAWLSASPRDGFGDVGFCWRGKGGWGLLRAGMLRLLLVLAGCGPPRVDRAAHRAAKPTR